MTATPSRGSARTTARALVGAGGLLPALEGVEDAFTRRAADADDLVVAEFAGGVQEA